MRTLDVGSLKQVRYFCPYLCFNLLLLFYFSISQNSSACILFSPGQAEKCSPERLCYASLAPDIVGVVAAVKNSAGTLPGRSRGPGHCTAAGVMTSERAASMQPVDEVVVLLGRGVPAASIR